MYTCSSLSGDVAQQRQCDGHRRSCGHHHPPSALTGAGPPPYSLPHHLLHHSLHWPPLQVPGATFTDADREALTVRIQFGGDEVVKAKAGSGSATLSMAYAGYLFTEGLKPVTAVSSGPKPTSVHLSASGVIKAMKGEEVTMCAYVESSITDAKYFASPCKFGPDGIKEVLPFGKLSAYEQGWFDKMLPELKGQIQKGIDFANK